MNTEQRACKTILRLKQTELRLHGPLAPGAIDEILIMTVDLLEISAKFKSCIVSTGNPIDTPVG